MINQLKTKIFNRKCAKFSFAQAGEDLVLRRIFLGVEKGFYVDVGAYHPYKLSNTYLFYLNGWRGINIEPRPDSRQLFDKVRPGDINLEVGIGEASGMSDYYQFNEDTLNQFAFTDSTITNPPQSNQVVRIQVEPLAKIFEHHIGKNGSIDFITIDTEGAEYYVLKSNNWVDFSIKVILVEQNKKYPAFYEVADLLKNKNYKVNIIPNLETMPSRSPRKNSSTAVVKKTNHCFKCFVAKRLWMVSVNMYDFMGLLDICPCNTLHAIKPYVSCK